VGPVVDLFPSAFPVRASHSDTKYYLVCGAQLRSDDPSALKEIILLIQNRVAEVKKGQLLYNYCLFACSILLRFMLSGVAYPCLTLCVTENRTLDIRITFMLDRIYDLKNNKVCCAFSCFSVVTGTAIFCC
jgi:hypothetical protein